MFSLSLFVTIVGFALFVVNTKSLYNHEGHGEHKELML